MFYWKAEKVDERDALFHRFCKIGSGNQEFDQNYRDHPENMKIDELIRSLPNFGFPESKTYHPLVSTFQAATFSILEDITRQIEWEPESLLTKSKQFDSKELTQRIKGFAYYLGADLV